MPNNDLISRAALLNAIDNERKLLIEQKRFGAEHVVVHHARRLIEELPAVDAAPVRRGKWDLLVAKQGECEWAADACCSLCGFTKRQIWRGYFPVETTEFARGTTTHYAKKVKLPNYCEQCGADLKGDKNEVD